MYVLLRMFVLCLISKVLQPSECAQEAVFRRRVGKYLANHVLRTEQTESEFECVTHCVGDKSCASVNHKISGTDAGKCELNSKAFQETSNEDEVNNQDFNYLEFTKRDCPLPSEVFSPETKLCVHTPSCKELLLKKKSLPDGAYTLQTTTYSSSYKVYCHMTDIAGCGGGGWTLVLKVNGSKNTFRYDSPFWTNKEAYAIENGLQGLAEKETKLASFWNTPFTKLCLGMSNNGDRRWMVLDFTETSLLNAFADGQYKSTTADRASWKSLIAGSSLQLKCNKQGFNIRFNGNNGMRIGLLGNEYDNCFSCNSWLGFGIDRSETVCGNKASGCCMPDNGAQHFVTFGYILVQ